MHVLIFLVQSYSRADKVYRQVISLALQLVLTFSLAAIFTILFAGLWMYNSTASTAVVLLCCSFYCYTIANLMALFHVSRCLRSRTASCWRFMCGKKGTVVVDPEVYARIKRRNPELAARLVKA